VIVVANPRKRFRASRGKGQHAPMRTYRVKRRSGVIHVRGWRARKKNPGMDGLTQAAIALACGLGATILTSYVVDVAMGTQSATTQTLAQVAIAAGAALLIPNPVIAAGVVTGILVFPLSRMIYTAVPALANPAPAVSAVVPTPSLGALRNRHRMQALHMGSLHKQNGMKALHMSALHMDGLTQGTPAGQAFARGARPGMSGALRAAFASR
jgi:hypothetical protein